MTAMRQPYWRLRLLPRSHNLAPNSMPIMTRRTGRPRPIRGAGAVSACVSKTPEPEVKLNPCGRLIESWPGSIASANPLPFGKTPWPGSNPSAVACSCAVSVKFRSDVGIFVNVMIRFRGEFGAPQKAVGSVDWQPETPELPGVTCRKSLIVAPGCAASSVGPEIPRVAPLKVRSKVTNGMVLAVYPLGKTKVTVSENLAVALDCPQKWWSSRSNWPERPTHLLLGSPMKKHPRHYCRYQPFRR